MKVAIYIRVSTGMQALEGHSLDVQEEMCFKEARSLGALEEDIAVFREAGASGEDMDRPQLMRMLDAVKQGQFDTVIVKHPDRLSRNMADKAIIVRELQRAGIVLVFVDVPDWNTSDEAQLLFNIIGSIAEYELRQIRRRTLSGKLRAAREGQVMPMGIHPYGYRYREGTLEILEQEARYVRLMFRWYAHEGLSFREVAKRLNELGVPTKTKRNLAWSHGAVQRILSSELYIGKYKYNRRVTRKAKANNRFNKRPRRVAGWHDEADWITIDVAPVIDDITFQLATERRIARRGASFQRTRYNHLLQGLITCETCGLRWHAAGQTTKYQGIERFYRRPACRSDSPKATICPHRCRRIDAADLEAAVWHQVVHTIIHSRIWQHASRQYATHHRTRLAQDLDTYERQLESVKQRQERLVNLYVNGDVDADVYRDRKVELSSAVDSIRAHIGLLQKSAEGMEEHLHESLEKLNRWLLGTVSDEMLLKSEVRKQILGQLVTGVFIHATTEGVKVTLDGLITQVPFL